MRRFSLGVAALAATVVLTVSARLAAAPDDPPIGKIAFGSCADQDKPLPIFDKIADAKPDLLLLLGDNIYADLDKSKKVTTELIKEKYDTLGKLPGWQRLKATCPMLAVWDDHDYGLNDAGEEWELKDESKKLLLDFFEVPADAPRRKRGGVYTATVLGPVGKRVQVIMLDGRYFRSKLEKAKEREPVFGAKPYIPNTDDAATMLGADQWKWLEDQFKVPAELRLVCSGVQVVSDEHPFEKWANFPKERERLYKLITDTKAGGVIVLSGDRHLGDISCVKGALEYPLFDVTASGFNQGAKQWRAPEKNSYRVGGMPYGDHFGFITIDWAAADPTVCLQLRDVAGDIVVKHAFPISLIQKKIEPVDTNPKKDPNPAPPKDPKKDPPKDPKDPPKDPAPVPEGVVGAADANKLKAGDVATVQFEVKGGKRLGTRYLLNSMKDFRNEENFTIVLEKGAASGKYKEMDLVGKTVKAKGKVAVYQGKLQLTVSDEADVEVVEKK